MGLVEAENFPKDVTLCTFVGKPAHKYLSNCWHKTLIKKKTVTTTTTKPPDIQAHTYTQIQKNEI